MIDGYPDYMMDSIKLVEKKRDDNISTRVKSLSMKEREEVLSKYHPDYMKDTKRKLQIGVDKGAFLYNGIVDLLEAKSVLDTKAVDLSSIDYDVDLLIIGGGGAGTVAALFAYESGVPIDKILIVTWHRVVFRLQIDLRIALYYIILIFMVEGILLIKPSLHVLLLLMLLR
jgi:succinate dehydrogenase / fumarate reductase flavoprotein subunit